MKNKTFTRGGHLLSNLVPGVGTCYPTWYPGRALTSQLGADAWTKKQWERIFFPELGSVQCCHGLGKENTFCRKWSFFQGSQNSKAVERDTFSENTACEKGCFRRSSEQCTLFRVLSSILCSSIGPTPTPLPSLGISFPRKARCYERRRHTEKSRNFQNRTVG